MKWKVMCELWIQGRDESCFEADSLFARIYHTRIFSWASFEEAKPNLVGKNYWELSSYLPSLQLIL